VTWEIQPYQSGDLDGLVQLWTETGSFPARRDDLGLQDAVELLGRDGTGAFVARSERGLEGGVIAASSGGRGWLHRLVVRPGAHAAAIRRSLVHAAVAHLDRRGVTRSAILLPASGEADLDLEDAGFERHEVAYYERRRASGTRRSALEELGGRTIDPRLWDEIQGMDRARELIERRIILPLTETSLAARHGVTTPRAMVIFGPPGTGKTTFAKAIAGRLGWPFVEMFPSELAADGADKQAAAIRGVFERVRELDEAVLFVDEVEDVAAARDSDRKVAPGVTNELLKQIPLLRQAPYHLLIVATNWIRQLDAAFLRPGRFDYVLPVGTPDAKARQAIWTRYLAPTTDEPVDVEALVEASQYFTPADIEFAVRKAAQAAFEREHFQGRAGRARTDDFLAAIAATRPSLTRATLMEFEEDAERYART
jgi:transitional endoplasmic reticulum ATPase